MHRWWTTGGERRARNDFLLDGSTPVLGGATGAREPGGRDRRVAPRGTWTPDWDPDPVAVEVVVLLPLEDWAALTGDTGG
jgi:hypothetical protein